MTWFTNFSPTYGTCMEKGIDSCTAVEVQTFLSGNLWNCLLCWSYLIKQQWAVWPCEAGQALVSPVPGPSLMIVAPCSAGSIVLLPEERQCQSPGDYVPLQKQWVETDGKGCCTPAHLLSISLLQMVPHICQLLPFNWKFRCSPFGLRRGQNTAHQSRKENVLGKKKNAGF